MPEPVPVHPLTRLRRIRALLIRHESEALGTPRLSVFRKEYARDAAVTLEDLAEVGFFGELGDLGPVSLCSRMYRSLL